MSQGPQDWIAWFLGFNQVWNNGQAVGPAPGGASPPRILNLLNPGTIVYNPTLGSIDITFGSGIVETIVSVVGPATIQATPYAVHEVDVTAGAVEIDWPTGAGLQASGVNFNVKVLAGNPATHNLTLKAPATKNIEGIMGTTRLPGDYSSQSIVISSSGAVGAEYHLRINGAGNVSVS